MENTSSGHALGRKRLRVFWALSALFFLILLPFHFDFAKHLWTYQAKLDLSIFLPGLGLAALFWGAGWFLFIRWLAWWMAPRLKPFRVSFCFLTLILVTLFGGILVGAQFGFGAHEHKVVFGYGWPYVMYWIWDENSVMQTLFVWQCVVYDAVIGLALTVAFGAGVELFLRFKGDPVGLLYTRACEFIKKPELDEGVANPPPWPWPSEVEQKPGLPAVEYMFRAQRPLLVLVILALTAAVIGDAFDEIYALYRIDMPLPTYIFLWWPRSVFKAPWAGLPLFMLVLLGVYAWGIRERRRLAWLILLLWMLVIACGFLGSMSSILPQIPVVYHLRKK